MDVQFCHEEKNDSISILSPCISYRFLWPTTYVYGRGIRSLAGLGKDPASCDAWISTWVEKGRRPGPSDVPVVSASIILEEEEDRAEAHAPRPR